MIIDAAIGEIMKVRKNQITISSEHNQERIAIFDLRMNWNDQSYNVYSMSLSYRRSPGFKSRRKNFGRNKRFRLYVKTKIKIRQPFILYILYQNEKIRILKN
jgi:hypothetical protein